MTVCLSTNYLVFNQFSVQRITTPNDANNSVHLSTQYILCTDIYVISSATSGMKYIP